MKDKLSRSVWFLILLTMAIFPAVEQSCTLSMEQDSPTPHGPCDIEAAASQRTQESKKKKNA